MLDRLLQTPKRRGTIMYELLRFFNEDCDTDWLSRLDRFLKEFAGTEFVCPGPQELSELSRDRRIVIELAEPRSVADIIAILREHELPFAYIQEINRLCHDREVVLNDLPASSGERLDEATKWARRYPSMVTDIVAIYGLDSRQHAELQGGIGSKSVTSELQPSKAQAAVLQTIKDRRRSMTTDELEDAIGTPIRDRTIEILEEAGYVTITKTGRVRITPAGRKNA